MRKVIKDFFKLKELNTNIRTEIIAGITTFMAMAYIIFVNPAMISQTGMDFGSAMMATCISAAFATIMMGLYAKYPIAQAPGMGENAFFTGRGKEVHWLVYLLAVLFILRFVYLKAM